MGAFGRPGARHAAGASWAWGQKCLLGLDPHLLDQSTSDGGPANDTSSHLGYLTPDLPYL